MDALFTVGVEIEQVGNISCEAVQEMPCNAMVRLWLDLPLGIRSICG